MIIEISVIYHFQYLARQGSIHRLKISFIILSGKKFEMSSKGVKITDRDAPSRTFESADPHQGGLTKEDRENLEHVLKVNEETMEMYFSFMMLIIIILLYFIIYLLLIPVFER